MTKKLATALLCAGLLSAHLGAAQAAVSAEEAKKLGAELTPFGAEKAGNKEGTIPAYTGGLTTPPANYDKSKNVRPDPFANEKPLVSVSAKNMDRYADKLTEGTKALMKAYADFRIDVYTTQRTVAYPKFVLDNSVKNATRGKLSDDGLSLRGARGGIPFPIPKSGNEVMYNYLARWQGFSAVMPKYSAYNIDAAGKLVLSTQGVWTIESPYYDDSKAEYPSYLTRAKANYTGPARRAGESIMTQEFMDGKGRRAYQYLPGQRRVRLAPDLAYDTPNTSTGGMSTIDDVNLYNGKMDRFDFQLVGKKEMLVPYNAYRFAYHDKAEDVFKPKFINPDVVRWELHRVWVVDAKLKDGARHVYSRRTFYIDEDSWNVLASDQYDGRGQLWRPGFAYLTQLYDAAVPNNFASGHYDLIAGTYYINQWPGASGIKVSEGLQQDSQWTPDSLAAQGIR
ncbi:DUF1329 domain-containing protein [Ramlibacter solisilvae]|uniref:Outer membrane lipoprotein-sorting protein n=1 Tax=Ramlibacter tataouinensis TaxID=94132 RepID=A0A127JW69_9BURK|nr:DUF1329 domain-containing protein [Ramlibacter tataouinensis]AMO24123.1 hypothetical protein UC35_16325 [Ramlibacter tataouinensis]